MKKEYLNYGNVVETRNGNRYLYYFIYNKRYFLDLTLIHAFTTQHLDDDDITDDLKGFNHSKDDIVKVYEDYTCTKLLWERKEKPVLTEDEIRNLKSLKELGFNYIARNEDGVFCAVDVKPQKMKSYWGIESDTVHIFYTNHLFQSIKINWEDEEAYSIEELLDE